METIEPVYGGLKAEFAECDLKFLHQVGGSGEQHAPAVFHQRQADGGGEMRLPAAGSTDQNQIGALVDPTVTSADRHYMRLGDHRHRLELEGVESLARQQPGFDEMALNATAIAFGNLVFGERGEEASGGPAFLVRPLGKGCPALLDRGQPEVVEQQRQPGPVDGLAHAAAPISLSLPTSAS